MGAISIYPDLPGIGTDFSEADFRQQQVYGEEFEFSRWQPKTQDMPIRAASNGWDIVPPSCLHTLGKPLCPSLQDQVDLFDWTTEFSRSQGRLRSLPSQSEGLNPVPYNYVIPRGASPEGFWCGERPAIEQDSCSASNTWSPRPSEGHVESDAGFSSRASWCDPETPLTDISRLSPHYFPSGYGAFHSPESPSYISPLETQIYPDLDAEQVNSKHRRQEMKTGQLPYYKEAMNIVPSQIELTYFHDGSSSPLAEDDDENQMEVDFEDDKDDEDYTGRSPKRLHRRNNSNFRNIASSQLNKRATRSPKSPTLTKPSKVAKNASGAAKPLAPSPSPASPISSSKGGKANCPQCSASFPSPSALHKHTLALHTRPFTCSFQRYGCPANFGSKNEWKRHVSSQHLRLGIYRCDINMCIPNQPRRKSSSSSSYEKSLQKAESNPSSPSSDRPSETITGHNEFNRKDLFTQHVRRMHGPRASGSLRRNATSAETNEFDEQIEAIRQRCWVQLRTPPPRSFCGFCRFKQEQRREQQHDRIINGLDIQSSSDGVDDTVFEGDGAWDERMEHVGKHLERGETGEAEDDGLRQWMADEGLLLKKNGRWQVVGCGSRRSTLKANNAASGSSGGDKGDNDEDADGVMVPDE